MVDGYFPYVLKGKYPNGVFLKVTDKVAEKYDEENNAESINTFETKENNEFTSVVVTGGFTNVVVIGQMMRLYRHTSNQDYLNFNFKLTNMMNVSPDC